MALAGLGDLDDRLEDALGVVDVLPVAEHGLCHSRRGLHLVVEGVHLAGLVGPGFVLALACWQLAATGLGD